MSEVPERSQAERSGLCSGDRVLCINGTCMDNLTHAEVLDLLTKRQELTMIVRNTGALPFKG